jgi:nitrogen fixation NifU-like protein
MDIYAEELISNYEHPHNKGKISNPDAQFHEYNQVCGDDITVYLKIEGNTIKDIKFDGDGCAISVAAASMLTENVKGKTIQQTERMGFPELKGIIGIDPGPVRLKCATISLKALKEALFVYAHKPVDEATKRL